MQELREATFARVGLLGNPSDGYGGKAIALCLSNFRAEVTVGPSDALRFRPGESDMLRFASLHEADAALGALGCEDGVRLLRAALRRFCRDWIDLSALARDDPRTRFELSYSSDVPRQVGLAGSSAIVISALRALARWFDAPLPAPQLAELALAVELEELGIAAGAMDRVIQAHQGVMVMDLAPPRTAESYAFLDAQRLPPLFIAWDPRGAEVSGRAHGDLRRRWLAGDPDVLAAIERFRALVDEGVACLDAQDHDGFRRLMDQNFDLRAQIYSVAARDREMVAIARVEGAAAKLCGSGGAIVGSLADAERLAALEARLREAGYAFALPRVAPARAPEQGP